MGDTRTHSIFAPSASHRWLECPGSIKLTQKAPPQKVNPAAIEGTDAHWLAEIIFCAMLVSNHYRKTVNALEYVGADLPSGAKVTKVMAQFVQRYVDYVVGHHKRLGGELLIEQRFYLEKIDKRMFGSTDACLITAMRQLHIFDLKYGLWIVEPEDNTQLQCYSLGALSKFKKKIDLSLPVVAHICQPRAPHAKGQFRKAQFTIDGLISFGNAVKAVVKESDMSNPPLIAGEHCRFCPAEFICPELNKIGRKIFV